MTAPTDPPSGRALDAEIAARIFGYVWAALKRPGAGEESKRWLLPPNTLGRDYDVSDAPASLTHTALAVVPSFSGQIDRAWKIVERMREQGYRVQVTNNRDDVPWVAVFSHETRYVTDCGSAVGATAPLAICGAALAAIEGRRVDG